MKVIEILNALNIENCKSKPLLSPMSRNRLSIYKSGNNVYYYESDNVEDVYIYDESYLSHIGNFKEIIKHFENDYIKMRYVYVVCEILLVKEKFPIAVDFSTYTFDLNQVKNYLLQLDFFISKNLIFDIPNKYVRNCISQDSFYKNLCFSITEINCNKNEQYNKIFSHQAKKYLLGNVNYHLTDDVVIIRIYNDETDLEFRRTGQNIIYKKPKNRPYSLADSILRVLDNWKSYYLN